MSQITNASPKTVLLGTDDQSGRKVSIEPIELPTHMPKFYSFFQKGPLGPQVVDGSRLLALYGEDSFNPDSPYYNEVIEFATMVTGKGNPIVMERVIPDDASMVSNMTIYIDMVKDKVKKYKRNSDGSIVKDSLGAKVEDTDSPIDGYRYKIIKEVNTELFSSKMGEKKPKPGYLVSEDGTPSVMIPVMEFRGNSIGKYYDNLGFSIGLPKAEEIDPNFINEVKSLPFEFRVFKRTDKGTRGVVKDIYGGIKNSFVLRPNAKNPVTKTKMTLDKVIELWSNETNELLPLVAKEFDTPYIYNNHIDDILTKFYEVEKPFVNAMLPLVDSEIVNVSPWFDFDPDGSDEDNKYLINIFNGYSSKRIFYFAIALDNSDVEITNNKHAEIKITDNLPTFLNGGVDGTLNWNKLQSAIADKLDMYLDTNSEVMDMATNPENIMYDVGFDMEIKYKMVNFITNRKDTFIVLSTKVNSDTTDFSLLVDRARAIALKNRLQLAPESIHFGTSVARAMVVMGDGKLSSSIEDKRYPQIYDIALKSALMMGGTKWKKDKLFARGSDNVIESMYDLQPKFIPQGVKPALWNDGVVCSEPYDYKRFSFPGLQTIYDDDTSILNNYFNSLSITIINKVADSIRRSFNGVTELTPSELVDEVEKMARDRLKDKFGGVLNVVPKAMITSYDEVLGYSWTLVFNLYGNVSKTVMLSYIVAHRAEDINKK